MMIEEKLVSERMGNLCQKHVVLTTDIRYIKSEDMKVLMGHIMSKDIGVKIYDRIWRGTAYPFPYDRVFEFIQEHNGKVLTLSEKAYSSVVDKQVVRSQFKLAFGRNYTSWEVDYIQDLSNFILPDVSDPKM